jgi:tagaturonate reductase
MLDTCELFHLWVIEGYTKLFEELPFDKAGLNVILTDDITPYRTRKVRILNGAHTSLIPYALLSNVETVRDCMQNETLSAHLKACVFDEIIPTLDLSEEELVSYANSVLERFDNPYIRHYCSSIALNSVSKFKVRVLPSILEYVNKKNAYPEHLIFAFAKLIDFYRTDMVQDSPDVAAFMKTATVEEILANTALWDADLSFLAAEVKKYANS